MEIKKLTEEEIKSLKSQHKKERDKKVYDRIKAVLMYNKGYTYEQIAEILLLTIEGIKQQVLSYNTDRNLKPQNGGSDCKLNLNEQVELTNHLEINNYTYAKDIAEYVSYHKSKKVKEYLKKQKNRINIFTSL